MRTLGFVRRVVIILLLASSMSLELYQSPVYANDRLEDPEDATVYYSRLESRGRYSQLYDLMHPDAQRIIPEEVVVGWYENDFDPRDPGLAEVERVEYVDWTWAVNGKTYRNAAEVTYVQSFGDGSVDRNTVHLVERRGEWLWFWGPSREFVDEQIAIYTDDESDYPYTPAYIYYYYCESAYIDAYGVVQLTGCQFGGNWWTWPKDCIIDTYQPILGLVRILCTT